jgi:hypothetical protein
MALIQVYQRAENYSMLNSMYGRLIHHHLANGDKEAAVYAYDGLLSSFPDDRVDPFIPVRDWMLVCDYLKDMGMNREAAVEYERLAGAHPQDPLSSRAALSGGESALAANDNALAMRLFIKARDLNTQPGLLPKIEAAIDKCRIRLENRATMPH